MKSDLELYDYWPYADRPKIVWPNGAKIAFWVAPNIEYYEINPPINPTRLPWARPHPDVVLVAQSSKLAERLEALWATHKDLPRPAKSGRRMGLPKRAA